MCSAKIFFCKEVQSRLAREQTFVFEKNLKAKCPGSNDIRAERLNITFSSLFFALLQLRIPCSKNSSWWTKPLLLYIAKGKQ